MLSWQGNHPIATCATIFLDLCTWFNGPARTHELCDLSVRCFSGSAHAHGFCILGMRMFFYGLRVHMNFDLPMCIGFWACKCACFLEPAGAREFCDLVSGPAHAHDFSGSARAH